MRRRPGTRTISIAAILGVAVAASLLPPLRRAVVRAASAVARSADRERAANPTNDAPQGDASTTPAARDTAAAPALAPLPVAGVRVERAPFVLAVRGTGRAEAMRRVALASRVGERVLEVRVREGARVAAGDTLVVLDARPFVIALKEAEARLVAVRMDLAALLFADSSVSSDKRARAADRTGVTEAEQRVERARLDLENTVITAPFAGDIADVACEAGERVQAERPLVTLVDRDRIRVPIEVLESSFGSLTPGAAASLRFAALSGEVFHGIVTALAPELAAERGTGIAFVELQNRGGRIRPGMYAEADLAAQRFEDRISVPRAAVLERGRRLLVFIARDGRAEWSYVEIGLESEHAVEITSGVAPGDVVLVDGHLTLAHGAPVRVTLSETHASDTPP
jgi:RND family efflux transporter MFP subunit